MPIAIKRRNGVPLYIQVRRQIERLVRLGIWERGRKLPTERQLATALGVSRNTVSAAYRELESEGLLIARQGSGTYVAESGYLPEDGRERLRRMLDLVLDEALEIGMSPRDLVDLAREQAESRADLLSRLQVAFVECNREQLDSFTRELESGSGVNIRRVLLDDLRRDPEDIKRELDGTDLVVTTLFHLDEVREFLPDMDVLGVALDPDIETMVRIARWPSHQRAGLVSSSVVFADRVKKSLAGAGIHGLDIVMTATRDRGQLEEFLRPLTVVIASPARRREVERAAQPGTEVVEFIYRPDAGSVNLLRSVLLERKRQAAATAGPA